MPTTGRSTKSKGAGDETTGATYSLAALRKENWRKTIEDDAQVPQVEVRDIPCPLPSNVDAVTVGTGHLKNVAGVALLPGGNVLVADETAGLILFNFEGSILKTVCRVPFYPRGPFQLNRPEWKNIRSPIYHKEHVLVSLLVLLPFKKRKFSSWRISGKRAGI